MELNRKEGFGLLSPLESTQRKVESILASEKNLLTSVTSGNHVTILRKDDGYKKPFGSFTSNISGSFTSGVWSEKHDVLGLVDDSETFFFIRANGEEISKVTKRNLKVSASVLGLMEDDCDLEPSCLCSFSVLTSDGLIHHVEISKEPSASAFSKHASNSIPVLRKQFPNHVSCFDYHPDLSFILIVGSAAGKSSTGSSGSSCISLWHKCQNSGLELLSTTKSEGVYCETKDDQLAYPKILISPQGSHVASIDSNGCMHLFQLEKARFALSCYPSEKYPDSLKPDKSQQTWKESLRNVVDFTWWTDDTLTILKRSGHISIFDISRCVIVQEDATVYSMPVVERVRSFEGHIFLLESSTQEPKSDSAKVNRDPSELHHTSEHSMSWRLISFTEKTIPEKYKILIEKGHYQEALDFADSHGLDRDEVFKSRWLNSEKGVSDVNMILSKIKDKAFVLSECLDRIGPTEDSMKALLAHGLNLTNHYVFAKSEDQESQQHWEFRLARLRLLQFTERLDTFGDKHGQADGSSRLTNTLVALKLSQIAAASISPGLEISPEDLSSIETSVSCFSKLSAAVATASQAEALLAILEGWEELFESKKAELLPYNDATDQGIDWGNDDWNDGWETLQELEPVEKEKKEYVVLAHPLNACWLDIFRKYIALSMPENVLRLIDESLQKPEEVLLEENEAESLAGILASTDPFLALKISLLLPYERIRSQCLNVVEEQLKQAGIPELSSQNHHEVLLLVIYSGTLSTIISNSCYGSVFSFLCYLIGKLSREFQEERVTQSDNRESNASSEKRFMSCFGELMFPCFVSELVKADQQILAGFLVTKFMHSNPSLSLINVAEASLRRYLEKQLESLDHSFMDNSEPETLKHTVSRLRSNSKEVILSALASLSTCTNSR